MRSTPLKFALSLIVTLSVFLTFNAPSARAQTDRVIFAVIGDYGQAGQPLLDVSNLIKSWNPDFIVTVGDNNYPHGQAGTIDDNIGQYFHEYIFKYKGKYGNGSPTRRFYPSLGNHDWDSNINAHFDFFGYYSPVTYYEFTQGPVHFFILDSDRNEPDGVTAASEQATWLRKAMTASASPFNVVVFHHAPYSSGRHGSTAYMRWPFKEWGADVVLTGHDHVYERLLVNDLPYFVNGIGGAEIYNFNNILPESQVRFNQDFGAMRVEANPDYMKFQMFTRTGILVDEYTVGGSAPVVSAIVRAEASPTYAGVVNFQVTFSEAVSGVDISDFLLNTTTGAGITNVTGSGNSYLVTVNTGGDETLRLDLTDNDSVLSSLGIPLGGFGAANGNFTAGESYTVDKTPPSIMSILPASPNPTNAASVDFAVTFSEPVTGVDSADFAAISSDNAMLTGISGAGANYIVTVATGGGTDNLRLDFIDNDSVVDLAGSSSGAGFTSGGSYIVDRAAPAVTAITSMSGENASSVEYAVSFSEPVTGVDGGDFFLSTINGAAIASISGAGSQYVVSVSLQPGSDSIRLDMVDNDSITDALGNPLNGSFMGAIVNIAIDSPIVTSIIRAGGSPVNAASVDFIVTFSEPVEGVDMDDFLAVGGAGIITISDSNPFYIVSVAAGANDGELKLELLDNDSIHNAQGVALGGAGAGNANFNRGEVYMIDRTPPQVTSIIRASGNPSIDPAAEFIVTFSEPVNGVESGDFLVTQTNAALSSVISMQNADPFYWVSVRTGAGSGTIRLDLFDNGNIADRAGNPLANNFFTSGESFSLAKIPVDFAAPSVKPLPNAITNNPLVTIQWSSIWNAAAYELFIARDSGFSQIVLTQTVTETSLALQTALSDGGYFARVRAYDPSLNPGKFSAPYAFTVDTTPPLAPTLLKPANGASAPRWPWLLWSGVGAKFQVEADNNADFSSPEFSTTTSKKTVQIKSLLARQYYWRVRAMDAAGNWGAWSAVSWFRSR